MQVAVVLQSWTPVGEAKYRMAQTASSPALLQVSTVHCILTSCPNLTMAVLRECVELSGMLRASLTFLSFPKHRCQALGRSPGSRVGSTTILHKCLRTLQPASGKKDSSIAKQAPTYTPQLQEASRRGSVRSMCSFAVLATSQNELSAERSGLGIVASIRCRLFGASVYGPCNRLHCADGQPGVTRDKTKLLANTFSGSSLSLLWKSDI